MLTASFYFVFLVFSSLTPDARCSSVPSKEKADTNILELKFSVDELHYLNAARVGSSTEYDNFDCTFKCLRNPFCLSINLAASKDANGKLWCELLSSDKYRNVLNYRENKTSHHLFLLENRVIYYQFMTPSWLEAYASYIDKNHSSTAEQLTFNPGSLDNALLLKVPLIRADILDDLTPATLKIVVSLDEDIGKNDLDSDPKFGVSDGISFVGFETPNEKMFDRRFAPCFGMEGTPGNSLSNYIMIDQYSPLPNDSMFLGHFVITLKLKELWGSCYTAHDGGFVKTAVFNKQLLLSKGLTLQVYKDGKSEKAGIKFIEVTVM